MNALTWIQQNSGTIVVDAAMIVAAFSAFLKALEALVWSLAKVFPKLLKADTKLRALISAVDVFRQWKIWKLLSLAPKAASMLPPLEQGSSGSPPSNKGPGPTVLQSVKRTRLPLPSIRRPIPAFSIVVLMALALGLSGSACAWWSRNHKALEADVIDCGKEDVVHGGWEILGDVLSALSSGDTSALGRLATAHGISVVDCTIARVEKSLTPASTSQPAEVPPETARMIETSEEYLKTQPTLSGL